MASGRLEFRFSEIVGVDATVNALQAAVIDFLEANDNGVADSGGVDGGNGANFVEPVGLWTLDAHLGAAGDRHRWALGDANGAYLAEWMHITATSQNVVPSLLASL